MKSAIKEYLQMDIMRIYWSYEVLSSTGSNTGHYIQYACLLRMWFFFILRKAGHNFVNKREEI